MAGRVLLPKVAGRLIFFLSSAQHTFEEDSDKFPSLEANYSSRDRRFQTLKDSEPPSRELASKLKNLSPACSHLFFTNVTPLSPPSFPWALRRRAFERPQGIDGDGES